MPKENKKDRFKRVAEKRVQNILDDIRSLSQLSNPKIYEWNDKQLDKMWKAISNELKVCKKIFKEPDGDIFKL